MGLGHVYVDCRVDIEDVLDGLSDEQLVQYLSDRNLKIDKPESSFERLTSEAYDYLCECNFDMAKLRLEQALFPRFKNLADCIATYSKMKEVVL